jgi:hypothetical protein
MNSIYLKKFLKLLNHFKRPIMNEIFLTSDLEMDKDHNENPFY